MTLGNLWNLFNSLTRKLMNYHFFINLKKLLTNSLKSPLNLLNVLGTKKLNLVLDLDETLIKCIIPYSIQHLNDMRSYMYYLCDFEFNNMTYCIFYRPYLFECLYKWSGEFNLYIYTHSVQIYCDKILENIRMHIPSIKINKVWSRGSPSEVVAPKNLDNLAINYNDSIIIDDNIKVWDHSTNVINIKTFLGPIDLPYNYIFDNELLKINKYLDIILDDIKINSFSLFKNASELYISRPKYNLTKIIVKCNTKYRQE